MFRNLHELLWKVRCLLSTYCLCGKLNNVTVTLCFFSFYVLFFYCSCLSVCFLMSIVDLGHRFYCWQSEEKSLVCVGFFFFQHALLNL